MEIGTIKGCTRVLGKNQGYRALPLRDDTINDGATKGGTPVMHSAWIPNEDERKRLTLGANIVLSILGTVHPPVVINVSDVPERQNQ